MKRVLKIILIIIIVILLILFATFLILAQDPIYDKSENLTVQQIQNIIDKRKNLDNIYVKYTGLPDLKNGVEQNKVIEKYRKGDTIKTISTLQEDGTKSIIIGSASLQTKGLFISEDAKVVMNLTLPTQNIDAYPLNYEMQNEINASGYFKYLGKTTVNGRKVIAVKLYKDENWIKNIVYFDEETGMLIKEVARVPFLPEEVFFNCLEIKQNVVTDEDIAFIDYETIYPDYKVVEME